MLDRERAGDDDGCGTDDAGEHLAADDRLVLLPRRLRITSWSMRSTSSDRHGVPLGVHQCQVSCRRQGQTEGRVGTGALTVHEAVGERDLHRAERVQVAQPEHCAQRVMREGRGGEGADLGGRAVWEIDSPVTVPGG